ncbi:MAG TPA: DUF1343 domain-containing protein, partial [Bacteroidota bacterium]|nr:DUF1343 domain-containing protein [Bacteroidota bacterium]
VMFRPVTFRPFYGTWKEKEIHGTQIYIAPGSTASLMSIQFYFMQVAGELWPDRNPFLLAGPGRRAAFDRVAGSDSVRILFTQRMRYDDVRPYLEKDVQAFREKAKKYLLY